MDATAKTSQWAGGFANVTRAIYSNNSKSDVGLEYINMASEGLALLLEIWVEKLMLHITNLLELLIKLVQFGWWFCNSCSKSIR